VTKSWAALLDDHRHAAQDVSYTMGDMPTNSKAKPYADKRLASCGDWFIEQAPVDMFRISKR
jgi:hypothetical protein